MKWLLQNVRRRAGFATRNPLYALGAANETEARILRGAGFPRKNPV